MRCSLVGEKFAAASFVPRAMTQQRPAGVRVFQWRIACTPDIVSGDLLRGMDLPFPALMITLEKPLAS